MITGTQVDGISLTGICQTLARISPVQNWLMQLYLWIGENKQIWFARLNIYFKTSQKLFSAYLDKLNVFVHNPNKKNKIKNRKRVISWKVSQVLFQFLQGPASSSGTSPDPSLGPSLSTAWRSCMKTHQACCRIPPRANRLSFIYSCVHWWPAAKVTNNKSVKIYFLTKEWNAFIWKNRCYMKEVQYLV